MSSPGLVLADINIPGTHIGIPTGPIDVGVPGFVPSFNPLRYISDSLNGLVKDIVDGYQKRLIDFQRPSLGSVENIYNTQTVGVALLLALTVLVIMFCVACLMPRKWVNVGQALIVSVVIFLVGPATIYGFTAIQVAGDSLARWEAGQYISTSNHSGTFLFVPTINNLIGVIIGDTAVLGVGAILLGIVYTFEYIALLIKIFGLIPFAISPLSEKTQSWWDWVLSAGIATSFFGRPVAVGGLVIGKTLIDHLPGGGDPFAAILYLLITMVVTIGFEFQLIRNVHKVVVRWRGRQNVNSKVSGDVNTRTKQTRKVTIDQARRARGQSMTAGPYVGAAVYVAGAISQHRDRKAQAKRRDTQNSRRPPSNRPPSSGPGSEV